jgi:hypothetical protein
MLAFAAEQKSLKALASVKKLESKGSLDQDTRLREAERRFLLISSTPRDLLGDWTLRISRNY